MKINVSRHRKQRKKRRKKSVFFARKMYLRSILVLLMCGFFMSVMGCMNAPPKKTQNVCDIFDDKSRWYKQARKASERWDVPSAVNMAIMYQESSFHARARPPREKLLGFIPWKRPSNAFGYSQALKGTWAWYKRDSGHRGADRDDFDDAIDFISWYNHISIKTLRIAPNNAYQLYLAYHDGHGGFKKGTYTSKSWLINTAKRVSERAIRYDQQLKSCETRLNRSWWKIWR